MDNKTNKKFNEMFRKRTTVIFFICLVLVLVFAVRLIWLYNSKYKTLASEQRLKTIEIPADRGDIFDRNGNVLAKSIKVNALYYFPDNVSDEDKIKLESLLRDVLSLEEERIDEIIKSEKMIKITGNLTPDQNKKIKEKELKCLSISVENSRTYPLGDSLSYVLGFVDGDNEGQYGIESKYNDVLKGRSGLNIYTGTKEGNIIAYDKSYKHDATEGSDLTLTVDESIDNFVNTAAKEAYEKFSPKSISVIVTEVNTNEVLAMENYPKYDSNTPRKGRSDEEEAELSGLSGEEKVNKYYDIWRNISISDVYEPGSVFKLMTSAAAIEENTSTKKSTYYCKGIYDEIPGVKIKCIKWYDPHGEQTLEEALANSCNPSFVQIAQDIGKNKFYEYVKAFGFGDNTGIDLNGEQPGIIPKKLEDIKDVDLATMSYGHGLAATPIQMITAANAVVNGGYMNTPQIIKEVKKGEENEAVGKDNKRQVISNKTSEAMRGLMSNNVENGVASAVKMSDYSIGAKSGTTIKIEDGVYTSEKTVASFYSAFPIDKPKYSVLVVVDEPQNQNSGNSVAGSISKSIIENIIDYKNISKKIDINKEDNDIKVPNFVGETLESAMKIAKEKDLRISIENTSTDKSIIITGQSIDEGTKVAENEVIDLKADDSGKALIKVPNLVDLSSYDAKKKIKNLDLEIKSKGDTSKGKVVKTIPADGQYVEPGSVIELIYE